MREPGASFPPVGFNPIRMRPDFCYDQNHKTTKTRQNFSQNADLPSQATDGVLPGGGNYPGKAT